MAAQQAHEIHISIDSKGNITGEVVGAEGPSCTSISAWLDELGKVTEDRHTADYHKHPKQTIMGKR
jgi:hypothetical protein